MMPLKKSIYFICLGVFVCILAACETAENYNPSQPIILNDTSINAGRLIAVLYDINNQEVNDATVNVYSNFEDLNNNLPFLTVNSNTSGQADFGFILIGNYYITAYKNTVADTVAAQVISRQMTRKNMFLN